MQKNSLWRSRYHFAKMCEGARGSSAARSDAARPPRATEAQSLHAVAMSTDVTEWTLGTLCARWAFIATRAFHSFFAWTHMALRAVWI